MKKKMDNRYVLRVYFDQTVRARDHWQLDMISRNGKIVMWADGYRFKSQAVKVARSLSAKHGFKVKVEE